MRAVEIFSVMYPWSKALHIIAVMSWMAGLFYLPRLFVHHVERAEIVPGLEDVFQMMEGKLFSVIMAPAMIVTWAAGLALVMTPGVVDWSFGWPWVKGGCVLAMTWFHFWLGAQRKALATGTNRLRGRDYRIMNEVPTLLMVVIVLSVILKF